MHNNWPLRIPIDFLSLFLSVYSTERSLICGCGSAASCAVTATAAAARGKAEDILEKSTK
jgi:hypothetical protein